MPHPLAGAPAFFFAFLLFPFFSCRVSPRPPLQRCLGTRPTPGLASQPASGPDGGGGGRVRGGRGAGARGTALSPGRRGRGAAGGPAPPPRPPLSLQRENFVCLPPLRSLRARARGHSQATPARTRAAHHLPDTPGGPRRGWQQGRSPWWVRASGGRTGEGVRGSRRSGRERGSGAALAPPTPTPPPLSHSHHLPRPRAPDTVRRPRPHAGRPRE